VTVADALTLLGFGLAVAGLWLLFGVGWACLVAGIVLFVAGGLQARGQTRR
jgi:hypothetical protein